MHIIIFIIGVQLISWGTILVVGSLVDGQESAISAVVSIVAFGPLIMAICLRLIYKQKWTHAGLKLKIGESWKWYLFSIAFPLATIGLIVLIALTLGTGNLASDYSSGINTVLKMAGILFVPLFFAGIGEEFGWRGYLEPALHEKINSVVSSHLIVGFVWGIWHFPILMMGHGESGIYEYTVTLVGCLALGIVYGQLILRSGSVWPCVLMHAFSNTFTVSFGVSKLLVVNEGYGKIVSLSTTSLAFTSIWILAAVIFLRYLKKPNQVNP